jgi:Tfp pilus assembly pilus retraction ATPase PilT
MAAIDTLLRAVLRHQMDALVLAPGRQPRLRQADREHPVTKSTLDADKVARLVAEIAPAGSGCRPDGELDFDYTLDGTTFRFTAAGEAEAWSVRAVTITGLDPISHRPQHRPQQSRRPTHRSRRSWICSKSWSSGARPTSI